MRTRRSPRNQEILWRALGLEGEQAPKAPVSTLDSQITQEERILADPFMSKSSKAAARRQIANLKIRKVLKGVDAHVRNRSRNAQYN